MPAASPSSTDAVASAGGSPAPRGRLLRPNRRAGARRFNYRGFLRDTFGCDDPVGFRLCGMDEVGRGAFAGPLVAAAVVLPPGYRHPLLRDSKLLSAEQRETAARSIRRRALSWHVAEIGAAEINRRGIGWANVELFCRLVELIEADGYCADGNLRIPARHAVHSLVGGDALVPAISAASIIAKVHRDAYMTSLHDAVPHYNWASNKGYGAPEHRAALRSHGTHPEHRDLWVRTSMQLDLLDELVVAGAPADA